MTSGYDNEIGRRTRVIPPPPSADQPTRSNPWVQEPLAQRDTSQGDIFAGMPGMEGVDMTRFAGMPGFGGDSIDYTSPLENPAIADESKGLFLGSAMFDQVQTKSLWTGGGPDGMLTYIDPYRYVNSGLNMLEGEGAGKYGAGFNHLGRPAEASPASDLYMLYQRGPSGEGSTRADLQKQLFSAGLIQRDNPIPDMGWGDPFDQDYQEAWRLAVHESMRTGIPVMVLLRDRQNYFENNGGIPGFRESDAPPGPTRPTATIISEEDARTIVDEVSRDKLGRTLTDREQELANGIVSAIRDKMSTEANAAIDQQMEGGGTVSRTTDSTSVAEGEIENRFANESKAYGIAKAFSEMIGMA